MCVDLIDFGDDLMRVDDIKEKVLVVLMTLAAILTLPFLMLLEMWLAHQEKKNRAALRGDTKQ